MRSVCLGLLFSFKMKIYFKQSRIVHLSYIDPSILSSSSFFLLSFTASDCLKGWGKKKIRWIPCLYAPLYNKCEVCSATMGTAEVVKKRRSRKTGTWNMIKSIDREKLSEAEDNSLYTLRFFFPSFFSTKKIFFGTKKSQTIFKGSLMTTMLAQSGCLYLYAHSKLYKLSLLFYTYCLEFF